MAKQQAATRQSLKSLLIQPPTDMRLLRMIIVVLAVLLYANTLTHSYNLDDELVTENHRLTSKGISAIPEIFSSPYYKDDAGYSYEYRPVVLATFALEHSLYGDNPHMNHFINVVLYALLCVLLFNVLTQLLKGYSLLFPFLISILFTAYPLHTEVVASIKNRDEILALIFALLSLQAAFRYHEQNSWLQLLLIPLFFFIGILSKSTIISFSVLIPAALILLANAQYRTVFLCWLVLAVPTLFYSRLYSVAQQLMLLSATLVFISFIYAIRNYTSLLHFLQNAVSNPGLFKASSVKEVVPIPDYLSFDFLRNPLVLIAAITAITIPSIIAALGIYGGNMAATVVPLFFMAALFLSVRTEMRLLLLSPFALLLIAAAVKFNRSANLFEASLVLLLVTQLIASNKKIKVVALCNYSIYVLCSVLFMHSYFFASLLIFAVFIHPRLLPVTALLLLAAVANIFIKLVGVFNGSHSFHWSLLSLPLILIGAFLLWKKREAMLMRISVLSAPLLLLLYFVTEPPQRNNEVGSAIERSYFALNTAKAIDLTPAQDVRPLRFMEYPLALDAPFHLKAGTAMIAMGHYLKKTVLPWPMSFYYGYAFIEPTSLYNTEPIVYAITLMLLVMASFFALRKYALMAFMLLLFIVSLSVFSNLVQPVPGLVADRFLLIPSIAFCMGLVYLLLYILSKNSFKNWSEIPKQSRYAITALLLVYSIATVARNTKWKDRVTLFSNDIEYVSQSAQAHNLLAVHTLIASGKQTDATSRKLLLEKSAFHFSRALEIYPDFLNAAYDLGRTYEVMGKREEALNAYQTAMRIDTGFTLPCLNIAIIMHNQGKLEEAIPYYERFLVKNSKRKEAYANLSFAYYKLKQYEKAIETNRRLLNILPGAYEPTVNIAKTFVMLNEADSAIVWLEKCYVMRPTDGSIISMLVKYTQEQGYTEKAMFYNQQLSRAR
jgi:tetratricopeptide (TPR) repeat protein